jgi:hypothetical protein
VQNPLTTLPEAVASVRMVLDRQDGPTVFVGRSFSGMILTDAGGHTTHAAWREKPSFYAILTEDWTTNPDLERFHGEEDGRQNHLSEGKSPIPDIAARRNLAVDP